MDMGLPRVVRDRKCDSRTVIRGHEKPAILGRRTQRHLCLAVLAVIVYGTLGPIAGPGHKWIVPPDQWSWHLPLVRSDANDLLTNFLVYLPVGVALRLLLRRRGGYAMIEGAGAMLAAWTLSYGTELLQQAMPARSSNLGDVYVNTIAAFVGVLVAVPVQRKLRYLHAHVFIALRDPVARWRTLTGVAFAATLVLMLLPLKPRACSWSWGFDEWPGPADLRRGFAFAALAFAWTRWAQLRGRPLANAALAGGLASAGLAVALEFAQTMLAGHVATVRHALAAALCSGCGAWLAGVLYARPVAVTAGVALVPDGLIADQRSMRPLATMALLATALYVLASGLADTSLGVWRGDLSVVWAPFEGEFNASFARALTQLVEQGALFATLTLLCLYLTHGNGGGIALLLSVGAIAVVQVLRAAFTGPPATTTPLLAAAFAWYVARQAYRAVRPHSQRAAPLSASA